MSHGMRILATTGMLLAGVAFGPGAGHAAPVTGFDTLRADAPRLIDQVRYRGRGRGVGIGIGAGILGGAIIGSMLARPYYYDRPYYGARTYYAPPPPVYYDDVDDEVAYCMRRFRSYDPRSGTYLGYDGYRHPCP